MTPDQSRVPLRSVMQYPARAGHHLGRDRRFTGDPDSWMVGLLPTAIARTRGPVIRAVLSEAPLQSEIHRRSPDHRKLSTSMRSLP